MSSGKLQIVRVLGNPKKRKRKKATRAKKRKGSRLRIKKPIHGGYIIRGIIAYGNGYRHMYWGGSKWTPHRRFAKHFATASPKLRPGILTKNFSRDWVSIDAVPA